MKETADKTQEVEEKRVEEEKIGNDLETKLEVKREPSEAEDESSEKILNISVLTEGIEGLNIKSEADDKEEEDDAKSKGLKTRGPDGGRPTMFQYGMGDKPLPMPPMPNNFGTGKNYNAYHAPTQKQSRRMAEEVPDQPVKYTRPQAQPEMVQQPFVPSFHQQFGIQPAFCNNLSQPPDNYPAPPQGFNFMPDHTATTTMTQMRFTGSSSGGIVKVQSPVTNMPPPFRSSGGTIADDFLEELNIPENDTSFSQLAQNVAVSRVPSQLPVNDSYTKKAFIEARRHSDTDSGVESSEERSPYTAQTPSPASSVYTSPPSVDSAYGQSPNHEPGALNGMGSPKYQGMQSPASYRATPSPGGTSEYGSPLGPQQDEELFDERRINDLGDILDVINHDLTNSHNDKNLRRSIETQQKEISQMVQHKQPVTSVMPDLNMVNRPMNIPMPTQQNFVPMPQHPVQAGFLPQTTVSAQSCMPLPQNIPASNGQQSNIIILPPEYQIPNTQPGGPIVVIPVSTPQQQKKPQKLRPILPKMTGAPASSNNTASTSSAKTVTCNSTKPEVTMTPRVAPGPCGNGKGPAQAPAQSQKTDRLLMIARRTVADIPREDLRKFDDEGDTYLHIAVCRTDRHMVQALLERLHREGLDSLVDQENHKRQTPLYLAVYINQPVMVNMFIRFRANVNVLAQNLSTDGQTTEVKAAIHVAAAHGEDYLRTLCKLLKAKDLSINIVNNYGQTALHCAILAHMKAKRNSPERINSIAIIKTLLKSGADPTAQDKKSGKTPLMYAIEQRNLELVETILSQVEPDKVKNVVKTQAFDGSSCLKIAEGLKDKYNVQIWNQLWNSLQSAASGSIMHQMPIQQTY